MFFSKSINLLGLLNLGVFLLLLIIGGLGVEVQLVQYLGVFAGAVLLLAVYILKRKIRLPRAFILYSLFLALFLLNSVLVSLNSKKSLEVFSLFLGGGLLWIISYNLKKELMPWFDKLIVILGLFFGSLHFINYFLGTSNLVKSWSLYLQSNAYLNHNHIGDLWALVLLIVGFYIIKNSKRLYLGFLVPLGFYFLLISQSRAALVSLAAGFGYLAYVEGWIRKYKKAFIVFAMIVAGIFLYIGAAKSILLSRPYFVQSILGLINYPQGVGMGNFRIISKDVSNHILGFSGFSSVAHNIVLEVLSGLGILGFVFLYWLYKILADLWSDKSKKNILYQAVFFALTVNFLFDSTYFIPTLLWIWFVSLGLVQAKRR